MMHDCRRQRTGFTLIELLVTLAVFTAVLTVLVEGLHSGIRAWRSIRTHQVRHAQIRILADKIGEDFRHVAVIDDQPAIVETALEGGGEKIAITTTFPRKRQRAGLGWVWSRVEWTTAVDSEGTAVLQRTVAPRSGAAAVGNKPVEETLLKHVKSARFDYVGEDGLSPTWNAEQGLPFAVLVTVQPESGPEVVIPAWVPGGALLRRDIGG